MLNVFAAPLQGYTECIWRNNHNNLFGGVEKYYTPFLRIEKNNFRNKDIRDILPQNNTINNIVPQIIGGSPSDCCRLVEKIIDFGYSEIDINLGCPFPPIVNKRLGSGLLRYPNLVDDIFKSLQQYKPQTKFSVKTRLGIESPNEFTEILPIIEDFRPMQLTIHPRVSKQQYRGDLNIKAFDTIYSKCNLPLVFNGDVTEVTQIMDIERKYPNIYAVMIGRGLLQNPSLAREYHGGDHYTDTEILEFHKKIFFHYKEILQGESQMLSKIKPFWEYAQTMIDHHSLKAIKKSGTIAKYNDAISNIKFIH